MEEFLARLKAHKLVQWTLGYLAVSFALLPVLDIVAERFGWSQTAVRCMIIALGTGFLMMLVIAWYHGERGAQRVTRTEHAILASLLVLGGLAMWRIGPSTARPEVAKAGVAVHAAAAAHTIAAEPIATPAPIPAKSIAVLPFENLSTDKGNAYFADGMQDLILTKLADIGDLKVISRTSTAKYESHPDDLKAIGQQLGVATVLEGSVQKAGNEVLINVQLIDANADSHIWAQSYQRTLDNIFGVEGEVAEKVAAALQAKLTSPEAARVASIPTTNAAAYNAFLQGMYYEDQSLIPGNEMTAIDYYRKAVALDPHFVSAWTRLTKALSDIALGGSTSDARQAKAALDHALALAPDSPDVRMAQGWYLDYVEKDPDGAMAAFTAVAQSQPNNVQALFGVGVMHGHMGQWEDALGFLQKAVALAPQDKRFLEELVTAFNALRRYPEAVVTARRIVAIDPNDGAGWVRLTHTYELMGDPGSALAAYEEVPSGLRANPYLQFDQAHPELLQRNYPAARKLLAAVRPVSGLPMATIEFARGDVERLAGDSALARKHYLRAKALLEAQYKQSPNWNALGMLGELSAELGQPKEALAQVALAMRGHAAGRSSAPFRDECEGKYDMAQFQVALGNAGAAVQALDWLLARPAGNLVSVPLLRIDPTWDPIRKDPGFQALLKKYAHPVPASMARVVPASATSIVGR